LINLLKGGLEAMLEVNLDKLVEGGKGFLGEYLRFGNSIRFFLQGGTCTT
jgi:hypothetical protein